MGGDRYCGFCGKHETEVARLIAGPIANICNECVELQHGMLNEDPSRKRSLHEVLSRARQRRIAELEAENRRLREALEHFVEALNDWECGDERDTDCIASQPVASIITFGHLRRARAVLSQYGDRSEG